MNSEYVLVDFLSSDNFPEAEKRLGLGGSSQTDAKVNDLVTYHITVSDTRRSGCFGRSRRVLAIGGRGSIALGMSAALRVVSCVLLCRCTCVAVPGTGLAGDRASARHGCQVLGIETV